MTRRASHLARMRRLARARNKPSWLRALECAPVGVDWGRGPDGSVTFVYRSGEWYLVNNPEEAS